MSDEIGGLAIRGTIDTSAWEAAPSKFDKVAQQISQKASQLNVQTGAMGAPTVGRDAQGRFTRLSQPTINYGGTISSYGGTTLNQPPGAPVARLNAIEEAALLSTKRVDTTMTQIAKTGSATRKQIALDAERGIGETKESWFKRLEAMDKTRTKNAIVNAGTVRQAMEGALRGGGMDLLQGTGIRFPFLGLGPAFVGAAIATSAFVSALKSAIGTVFDAGHATMTLSSGLNLTRIESAQLVATGQQFNVTSDNMDKGLLHLADATKTNYPLFQRLGISVYDSAGKLRSYNDIAADTRRTISQISDPASQAAVAVAVYGDAAAGLKPYWSAAQSQIDASAGSIAAQTTTIAAATQATAQWDSAVGRLGAALARAGQQAAPLVAGMANIIDKVADVKAHPFDAVQAIAGGAANLPGPLGFAGQIWQRILGIGGSAMPNPRIAAGLGQGGIAPFAEGTAGAAGAYELGAKAPLSTDLEATRASLLGLEDAARSAGQSLLDTEHTRITTQQAIDSMIQDRAMQVAEQTAALTIALGDFSKTEQTAAQRARSQEKSFFAFRPDNALVRADQEIRYQRDLAIARQQQAWQSEALDKQQASLEEHTALLQAEGLDLVSIQQRLDANSTQLLAALAGETNQTLTVTLDGSGIDWTKFGLTREEAIAIITQVAGAAKNTVRSRQGGHLLS